MTGGGASEGLLRWVQHDRGSASLEVVLIFPALILVVTLIIQFALWEQATHVATAAAQDGAQTARLEGSTAAAGQSRAESFLQQAAPRLIGAPTVTASRSADVATVAVTGTVAGLVPGLHLRVEGSASAVVERYRSGAQP